MIYYFGLLLQWVARALIPTMLLLAGGTVTMLGAWWLVLRPRRISAAKGWLGLGLVVVAFGGWRSSQVWRDFWRPELSMFRDFVANPIPREVLDLAPATAAPVMFHEGAYISFHAPPDLVQRLVTHSLPGSKTLSVVEAMKKQSGRNPADCVAIAAPDGRGYLKVDLEWVAKERSQDSVWARGEVETFLKNRTGNVYVLLLSGDWGKFVSVVEHEPLRSNVIILQNLEHRR